VYIPSAFNVQDKQILLDFIQQNSFGILFSHTEQGPFASHLPFLYENLSGEHECLIGHMAKANPHWRDANEQDVLVVFAGPHTYISPTWYGESHTVPTWNYVTVHISGKLIVVEDEKESQRIVEDTLRFYESPLPVPWQTDFNDPFIHHLMKSIASFKIQIQKIEGKWKLSQNHSLIRQQNVVSALSQVNQYDSQEVARLMQQHIESIRSKKEKDV